MTFDIDDPFLLDAWLSIMFLFLSLCQNLLNIKIV